MNKDNYPREKLEAMAKAFHNSRERHDRGSRDLRDRYDIHMMAALEAGEAWDADAENRTAAKRESLEANLRDKKAQLEELKMSLDRARNDNRYTDVSRYAMAIVQQGSIIATLERELND